MALPIVVLILVSLAALVVRRGTVVDLEPAHTIEVGLASLALAAASAVAAALLIRAGGAR